MHTVVKIDRVLGAYADQLRKLGFEGRVVLAETLNSSGERVRLMTVAAEAKQTGLDPKTIERAQKPQQASGVSLAFRIRSEGGDIRLKFFGAEETPDGVVAHPFRTSKVFAHAFIKGGHFPDRVSVAKLNGQVFERSGATRLPIRTVRSGVTIPAEMVAGATAAVFNKGVATIVATTVVTRMGTMLPQASR